MSRFATGVTVITTGGRHCHGMTANAFTSVSLTPPLIACCVATTAHMHEAITRQGEFAVSVLGAGQEHLARHFTDRTRPRGAAQFERVPHHPATRVDAPLLTGAAAWLECRLATRHRAGDHTIFLGEVLTTACADGPGALLFHGGGYHALAHRATR
ncbi:flavin reductase [Saccharothrix syringae]|uniref:Flavin reductase n=2 Tax=Saccharothrix syringae TaxID=103733 RepID=A0A5Q0HE45_SACSY|nr:flavin reductase [Saccharothrix syringae]